MPGLCTAAAVVVCCFVLSLLRLEAKNGASNCCLPFLARARGERRRRLRARAPRFPPHSHTRHSRACGAGAAATTRTTTIMSGTRAHARSHSRYSNNIYGTLCAELVRSCCSHREAPHLMSQAGRMAQRTDGTAWSFLLLERRLGLALVQPLEQHHGEHEAEANAHCWYHDAHAWLGLGLGFGLGLGLVMVWAWLWLGGARSPNTCEAV